MRAGANEKTKWGPALVSLDTRKFNKYTDNKSNGSFGYLAELLSEISRSVNPFCAAVCIDALDLIRVIDANAMLELACCICTDHAPEALVHLFVGVICVLQYRSLNETCSRSWYRALEIICKKQPVVVAKYLLLQLLVTYPADEGSQLTAHPGSPQYELFQRLYKQVM